MFNNRSKTPNLIDSRSRRCIDVGQLSHSISLILWLWVCLIDTAVIGQRSSIELAAFVPGTVLCDYLSYVFMFLSVAISNMVATSLARVDKSEAQHQISILLLVGFNCGIMMFIFTKFFGSWALTAFTGSKNAEIVSAANTYVQIRGFAWPVVLVG